MGLFGCRDAARVGVGVRGCSGGARRGLVWRAGTRGVVALATCLAGLTAIDVAPALATTLTFTTQGCGATVASVQ